MARSKRKRGGAGAGQAGAGARQWSPDEFFRRLPADSLTPQEMKLRDALVEFLEGLPGPFPFTEWVDRRIGGEVDQALNDDDGYDLSLRGPDTPSLDIRPGDWNCPKCGINVFAWKDACFKCNEPKPGAQRGRDHGPSSSDLPPITGSKEIRPGDWTCPDCGNNVFAHKDACFKCGAQKAFAGDGPKNVTSPGGGQGASIKEKRDGDWTCPDCGINVFAYKDACFKCGALKAESHTSEKKNEVCKLFQTTGSCKYGDDCKFVHDERMQKQQVSGGGDNNDGICRLYQRTGSCKFGDECIFSHDDEAFAKENKLRIEFYDSLPSDSFTKDEILLRDALINFVNAHDTARTQGEAQKNKEIKQLWSLVQPRTFVLPLTEWIDRRIGGELEVQQDERGRTCIGILGELESMMRKRKEKEENNAQTRTPNEEHPVGPSRKKMRT